MGAAGAIWSAPASSKMTKPNPRERGRFGPALIAPTRHRPGVLELPGASVPVGSVPAGFASTARRPLEQRPKTASGVVLGQYKWATSHDSDFQNWVGRHENLMYDPNWTPAMRTEPNLASRDAEMMKLDARAINRKLAERCARSPPIPCDPNISCALSLRSTLYSNVFFVGKVDPLYCMSDRAGGLCAAEKVCAHAQMDHRR